MPESTVQVAKRPVFLDLEDGLERRREAALSGEEEFASLVHRLSRFAFQVAHSLLRNAEDSEDAVQEIFLKIYRNGSWMSVTDEKAFVARAVWRVCLSRLRTRRKAIPCEREPPDGDPTPEANAIAGDQIALVHRMIDSLPEELRQPLALSAVEEMNSRQIAAVMGISEGTVRTRLLRARQLVRQKLQRWGVMSDAS